MQLLISIDHAFRGKLPPCDGRAWLRSVDFISSCELITDAWALTL